MQFRLLYPSQVTREILNILSVLTDTQELSIKESQIILYNQMKNNHFTYVGYLEETPICIGSYIVLDKLGHNGGVSALIEDVAVHPKYQDKGYGKQLIGHLKEQILKIDKIYKIFLNCSDKNVLFYEKNGFVKDGNQMKIYV